MTEEIIETIEKFLKEAPPGEFEDCLRSIQNIVEDEEIIKTSISNSRKFWMLKNCSSVEIEGKHVILCDESCKEENIFINPFKNNYFQYDFESKKVIELENQEEIVKNSFEEVLLQVGLQFIKKNLTNGRIGIYNSEEGIKIVLVGSSISKENFRNALLIMKFIINDNQINGQLQFKAHLYENGNCAGNHEIEFKNYFNGENDQEKVESIFKNIKSFYDDWYNKSTMALDLLKNEGLNKLRRRLPIQKTKVDWHRELLGIGAMPGRK